MSRLILSQNITRDRNTLKEVWKQASQSINKFFEDDEQPITPAVHPVGVVAFNVHGGAGQAVIATPTVVEPATNTSFIRYSTQYSLHVPPRLWNKLSQEVPLGKNRATRGVYAKGGRNNKTLILANAVTHTTNYQFIPLDRGRIRLSCRQLAKLLRVPVEDVRDAQFNITVNGPHSLLVELND